MTKTNTILRCIKILTAVLTSFVTAATLLGCSFVAETIQAGELSFDCDRLTLIVDDEYDLSEKISSRMLPYTLKTSNEDIVKIKEGNIITAVAVGEATITASNWLARDTIDITVIDRERDSFSVSYNGELVQNVDSISEIEFVPSLTGALASVTEINWYVGGKRVKTLGANESFKYTPSAVGTYEIVAKCGSVQSEPIIVRLMNSVDVEVGYTGEIEQREQPYTEINFTATVTGSDDGNFYQWYDNGKLIHEGSQNSYVYRPTPGRHTIEVKVNGESVYSTDCVFHGALDAQIDGVNFDNQYPHVYLEYAAVGKVQVEITSPTGSTHEYSQNNSEYAPLFDDNGFDMGEFIELCATASTRRSYKLRIKSLGDGDVITAGEYSDYYIFLQLPSECKKYVSSLVPSGDHYITSDIEYIDLLAYNVIFREKKPDASVGFDCYIGYDRVGSASDLWKRAFDLAATSGSYSEISVTDIGGSVMRTKFKVSTANSPTRETSGARSLQLHASLPHINYDAAKYRAATFEFAIDKAPRSATVKYTDELYFTVQQGVKPLPAADSPSAVVYGRAREILRKICTNDMTDVQKAHAIYDWIMWQVTYDTPATKLMAGGEQHSAYYLEGVFGDGSMKIGDVAYNPYAVCDGMSKAYSLMCNMEGIKCVRVTGKAGDSLGSAGGHAWNKVLLDGKWYVVDCTWGDSSFTLNLDGKGEKRYELGIHKYLFTTDAEISTTHFEPYKYTADTVRYAPQTATSAYNVYSSMDVNGTAINCYVGRTEDLTVRLREIVAQYARVYKKPSTVIVPGGPNDGKYDMEYRLLEIYSDREIDDAARTTVVNEFRKALPSATVKVLMHKNTLLALVK